METNPNDIIWQASPTHLVNIHIYLAYATVIALLMLCHDMFSGVFSGLFGSYENFNRAYSMFYVFITLVVAFRTLENHMHSYKITDEVLREKYGVFNRVTDELELYRVRDSATVRPFHLMLFGYGNVVVSTTDSSSPTAFVKGVKDSEQVRMMIRERAEIMRRKRGIVEIGNY